MTALSVQEDLCMIFFGYVEGNFSGTAKKYLRWCHAKNDDYFITKNGRFKNYTLTLNQAVKWTIHFIDRNLIYGVGINDYDGYVKIDGFLLPCYKRWTSVLERCYDESSLLKRPEYRGCEISSEWKYFSVFKKWYDENYLDGYYLDKDILNKNNKIYSEQMCLFVPERINNIILSSASARGELPIGVTYRKDYNLYHARVSKQGKRFHAGYFKTIDLAFEAYKEAKEK
jgi:hypothetical protein